jgi:large subunit ribosomal protein L18
MAVDKSARRQKIKQRIRKKISGTSERPRLCVYRSNKGIYAQLVDDSIGKVLGSASCSKLTLEGDKSAFAKEVGKLIADKAKALGVSSVVFDRNGYLYHGRVKALADAARENGLQF